MLWQRPLSERWVSKRSLSENNSQSNHSQNNICQNNGRQHAWYSRRTSFRASANDQSTSRQVFWLLDHATHRTFPFCFHFSQRNKNSGIRSFRPQLQRRDRDGFAPSSLFSHEQQVHKHPGRNSDHRERLMDVNGACPDSQISGRVAKPVVPSQ